MSHDYYILVNGEPEPVGDVIEWAYWFEANINARHVGFDHIGDTHVSTVFLGLNHNFWDDGPPVLFETMVFGGPLDHEGNRYSTTQEAIDGHNAICARVRDMTKLIGEPK